MKREYFRILAPFTNLEDVKLLKDAGADELYCGYITEELTKRYPLAFATLNRRGEKESFEDYQTFKKATELANKYNLPVYVAINGLYTPEQYPLLLDLVKKIEPLEGVKGVIVADLGFFLTLKRRNFKKEIHISTGGTCFNPNTADFYYSLGANRVVLPRQVTSSEIGNIVTGSKSKIDIEIFIINEVGLGLIDGFCTFLHCKERPAAVKTEIKGGFFLRPSYYPEGEARGCHFYFFGHIGKGYFKTFNAKSYREEARNLRFQPQRYKVIGCRICDLYQLKEYPIRSLKIIGRGEDAGYVVKSVKLVSEALSYLADSSLSKKEYKQNCKNLFSKAVLNNSRRCTKFDCYFSSHWVKNEKKI